MADAGDLKSPVATRVGSSPAPGTQALAWGRRGGDGGPALRVGVAVARLILCRPCQCQRQRRCSDRSSPARLAEASGVLRSSAPRRPTTCLSFAVEYPARARVVRSRSCVETPQGPPATRIACRAGRYLRRPKPRAPESRHGVGLRSDESSSRRMPLVQSTICHRGLGNRASHRARGEHQPVS